MAAVTNIDIKRLRELRRMTAADLGEKIGRDPTTIYNWESGKCDPDPDTVLQIAEALDDPQFWFDWMGSKYISFRKMVPELPRGDIPCSTLAYYEAAREAKKLIRSMFGDAADGQLDDLAMVDRMKQSNHEMARLALRMAVLLGGGEHIG